jgi:pSer/pThr/pTyr-binding forkhead associated (FHA) protein
MQVKDTDNLEEFLIDESLIPTGGIAIYVVGTENPVFRSTDREFVIGRKMEETSEPFLDLSNLGGYLLGLSRRHATIRRADSGYEVIDLASTNGTWLNGERLTPHQPYPLPSGSQLRLGRMRFFVLYRAAVKTRQKT